uniref:Uncharacterized protein n=1 Tax=Parascaris equorum TaxID=6256 RepID=A0A914RSH4_PAREQ
MRWNRCSKTVMRRVEKIRRMWSQIKHSHCHRMVPKFRNAEQYPFATRRLGKLLPLITIVNTSLLQHKKQKKER